MARLTGKVAIITGASGGIGKAAAWLFLREGANILLVDRDEDPLARMALEMGSGVGFQAGDVSKLEDAVRYVRRASELFGGVDVL